MLSYIIFQLAYFRTRINNSESIHFADDFLEEHRRVLESRLQPVLREITDSRARTREELESLYRKIVSAVLLRSGLGSPTDIAVVREATGKSLSLMSIIITSKPCINRIS